MTRKYGRCHPNDATSLCRELGGCMEQVASWMSANRLQLNAAKMEFLWLFPPRRCQLSTDHLVVCLSRWRRSPQLATLVSNSTVTRDTACELLLWHSSSDSPHPPIASALNLDVAYPQFHHAEAWLLQRGTGRSNALRPWPTAVCHWRRRSSRLTVGAQRYDHVLLLLVDLHWLRMAECIKYKLSVYTCIPLSTRISTMLPSTDNSFRRRAWNHGVVYAQSHQPTWLYQQHEGQHWVTVPSL